MKNTGSIPTRIHKLCHNFIQGKQREAKFSDHTKEKQKTLSFQKDSTKTITSIDKTVNDEPFDYVNIQVKIVQKDNLHQRGRLLLKVYVVTDDGTTTIQLTLFQNLIRFVTKKGESFISDVQMVTFHNSEK